MLHGPDVTPEKTQGRGVSLSFPGAALVHGSQPTGCRKPQSRAPGWAEGWRDTEPSGCQVTLPTTGEERMLGAPVLRTALQEP